MVVKTDFFWTDANQAAERLNQSVVLYDNEPVLIHEVLPNEVPIKASVLFLKDRSVKNKQLNSPKFGRFRKLPVLGWMNPVSDQGKLGVNAMFVTRRVISTRSHGLTGQNTVIHSLDRDHGRFILGYVGFTSVISDRGFLDMHAGKYPSLSQILMNIADNSVLAYNHTYAVHRDGRGLRWLMRQLEPVGLFTGNDTLNLLSKFAFLREEIMEDDTFTLSNIREL